MDERKGELDSDMKTHEANDMTAEDLTIRMRDSSLNHEGNYGGSLLMITDHFILSHTCI
jgi:hypothetical protein